MQRNDPCGPDQREPLTAGQTPTGYARTSFGHEYAGIPPR